MPNKDIVKIPYFKVKGNSSYPIVYMQAAQHGVELTGAYTLRLLLKKIENLEINGTLIVVPIANPLAVKWRRHFYKMQLGEIYSSSHPHQMNRLWPGKVDGNETERIAYSLYKNLVESSDYVIDLHCHEQWNAPVAIADGWNNKSIELAEHSLLPFITIREKQGTHKGMIEYVATEAGKTALAIEHSGQRWVFPDQAKLVCNGLINILRYLKVIKGEPIKLESQVVLSKDQHVDIYSPEGEWIVVTLKKPAEKVEKGEEIVKLLGIETFEEISIKSPINGIIYQIGSTRPNRDTIPSEEVQVALREEKYLLSTIYHLK